MARPYGVGIWVFKAVCLRGSLLCNVPLFGLRHKDCKKSLGERYRGWHPADLLMAMRESGSDR